MQKPFLNIKKSGSLAELGYGLDSNQVESLRTILPNGLVDFLEDVGITAFDKGRLRFCEPQFLSGVLPLIFKADSQLRHDEIFAFAFTPFSKIFCWNKMYGYIAIDLFDYQVTIPALTNEHYQKLDGGLAIGINLAGFLHEPYLFDEEDKNGKFMFSRAVAKLGMPNIAETFGFRLALPMGGQRLIENLQIMSAPEHFSIVCQLEDFVLIDPGMLGNRPPSIIRHIG